MSIFFSTGCNLSSLLTPGNSWLRFFKRFSQFRPSFFTWSGRTYSPLDAKTGERIWETHLDRTAEYHSPRSGTKSITLVDGKVLTTVGGGLVSLSAKTGEIVWEITGKDFFDEPLYLNGRVFLKLDREEKGYTRVVCLTVETGEKVWEFTAGKEVHVNYYRPLYHEDGKIYFATGEPALYCLDAESGTLIWMHQRDSPCDVLRIHGDLLLAGGEWDDETMECLNKRTGDVVWTLPNTGFDAVFGDLALLERFEDGGRCNYLANVYSGHILWRGEIESGKYGCFLDDDSGILYFSTSDGKAIAGVDVTNGKEVFRHIVDGTARIVDTYDQGLLVQIFSDIKDERCSVSVGKLIFLNKEGGISWEYEYTDKDMRCGRVDARQFWNALMIFREDGFMEAHDINAGRMVWEIEVRGTKIVEFEVSDRMYLSANDGIFYCLEADTGHILWTLDSKSNVNPIEGRGPPYIFAIGCGVFYVYTEDGGIYMIVE